MSNESETLLEFPCSFSVKSMGLAETNLDEIVVAIVRRHAPNITEGCVSTRLSKGGKYVSVTVTLEAHSKAQLDAIYQDLTDCEHVLMSL